MAARIHHFDKQISHSNDSNELLLQRFFLDREEMDEENVTKFRSRFMDDSVAMFAASGVTPPATHRTNTVQKGTRHKPGLERVQNNIKNLQTPQHPKPFNTSNNK